MRPFRLPPVSCQMRSDSFSLQPGDSAAEARAFMMQMAAETGQSPHPRLAQLTHEMAHTGLPTHTTAEIEWGARVAWRNAARCIGRMFWPALTVRDARDAGSEDEIFDCLLSHLTASTNGGDIKPMITVFRLGSPTIRILNAQLILYAGYRQTDGSVLGDPANLRLTELARRLGWRGAGTRFDVLPLMVRIGDRPIRLFDWPADAVLEVPIAHPENPAVHALGLKWFALPAVSGMALDMGGGVYTAAPSSGIYMGTEIGSQNLGDPRRYNQLGPIAQALGLPCDARNPLWRDQAMVELNRAVLHSFAQAGVRIFDHHTLSESFCKFRAREAQNDRTVAGHWPWLTPPLSANLSEVWHMKDLKPTMLKPGYFYQPVPELASPPDTVVQGR